LRFGWTFALECRRCLDRRAQAANRLRARAEGFSSNNEVGIWRTPKIPKSHWAREKCWLYFSALWRCALFFSGWDFRWAKARQRQTAREWHRLCRAQVAPGLPQ